jgi:two-component system, sensor histidine kinase
MTGERAVRVLNVNDRDIPRYVNEEIMRREGFDVTSVAKGYDALAAVRDDMDIVILDIKLPDIDGFEVCRRIKQAPETAGVVVLLTSATFVTSKYKVTGLDSGADGYLSQPFEGAELVATIRALLRARAAERASQALTKELQNAMEVRDDFLAMLGHELRNPIGAITTALHLLHGRRDDATLDRCIPVLDRQTRNLSRIIDDLLDISRITRGKVSLDRQVVDLRDVAVRCVQSLGSEVFGNGHKVEIRVDGPPVKVVGDNVRLDQIVANLVTNAVKYTPDGGHVEIRVAENDGRARLEVQDDGIGMDPATRSRVFDLFAQGKQGLDRSRGGLGLGLTVVRQLVELHGGTIEAASAGEGRGSTFTMTLPLAPAAGVAADPTLDRPLAGGLRLAVVEDNDDARELLTEVLVQRGYHVETAANGREGLALVLASRPDIALIDVGLPELDGYQVAREICASMNGTRPRLVAMTGYGQPEDRRRALAAGFDVHLSKPLSIPQLEGVLKALEPHGLDDEAGPHRDHGADGSIASR